MFTKLKQAWSFASNSTNIKNIIESVYNVVTKINAALDVLAPELALVSKNSPFAVYIPLIRAALNTVISVIERFGPLVGFRTIVYAQSDENPKEALLAALRELDEAVKAAK